MKIETVPLADLREDPDNARRHPEKNLKAIRGSLERFGQRLPLVVRDGIVVVGNGRLRVMRELGWETAEVVGADDLTKKEAQAFGIADNKSALDAEWDESQLAELLKGFGDPGLIADIGWDEKELVTFLDSVDPPEIVQDNVPEPPKVAVTKLGDVWDLGRHRVVCGDSATVKHDREVSLVFTSPPYGQQREYTDDSDVSDWGALMRGIFGNLPTTNDAQVLVNLGLIHREGEWVPYWDEWIEWMREQGWRRFGWYVWDQGPGLPGHWQGRLAPSFEFVFHFNKRAVQPNKWVGKLAESIRPPTGHALRSASGTNKPHTNTEAWVQPNKIPDSVIRETREKANKSGHPAVFSVAFASSLIRSWPGEVYDPFLGSGTTLIAAEQLDRTCYGIEISPAYCDVIVERWETLTGGKARRAKG